MRGGAIGSSGGVTGIGLTAGVLKRWILGLRLTLIMVPEADESWLDAGRLAYLRLIAVDACILR